MNETVKVHLPPNPEVGKTMEINGIRFEITEVVWTGGMFRLMLRKRLGFETLSTAKTKTK